MCKDPRTHDLIRTVAAIIDAHVRGETADVAVLACRNDDPRYLAQVVAMMAGLAMSMADRLGHDTFAFAFYLQAKTAPGISDNELRKRKVRRMLLRGIETSARYVAAMSIKTVGRDAARRSSRQALAELAVIGS
jgi:hypothetical protein